jgi:hypothetical protein
MKKIQRWLRSTQGLAAIVVVLVLVGALAYWQGWIPGTGTVIQPPEPEVWAKPAGDYTCLPTCDVTDGKMFSHVGRDTASFAADDIVLWIGVPASFASFEIGIFDGDSSRDNSGNVPFRRAGNWDTTLTESVYTLYADPLKDGSGTTVLATWRGNVDMPNNDWFNATIVQSLAARSPSGHYGYRLVVTRAPEGLGVNAFKVRSTGYLSTGKSHLVDASFAVVGAYANNSDLYILYPEWGGPGTLLGPSNYTGEWLVPFYVSNDIDVLEIWDGDFDHGSWDGSFLDENDLVTGTNFTPEWAEDMDGVRPQNAQGIGAPPDDNRSSTIRRSPAVYYSIIDPDGTSVYVNVNPSGTEEWQKFVVSTDPAQVDANEAHVDTDRIQPGLYYIHIEGLDLHNTVWFRIGQEVLAECADGSICSPPPVWPEASCPRTIGYWKNNVQKVLIQNRTQGVQESRATLEWGLVNVAQASPLFRSGISTSLPVAISAVDRLTDQEAHTILQRENDNSMMARALQQNLATWLNLGTGKIGPTTVVSLTGIAGGPFEGTVEEALELAQAIILNPASTNAQLERAKDIADLINNGELGYEGEDKACGDYHQVIPPSKQPPKKKDMPRAPKPPTPPKPTPEPEPDPGTCADLVTNSYQVENPTNNPFYGIKFNYLSGTEIKNGALDEFKFTVTVEQAAQMSLSGIQLEAKAGTIQSFAMMDCDFTTVLGCGEVAKDDDNNFVFQLAGAADNGDGTLTLRFWVFNYTDLGLSHVTFGLPSGIAPSSPTDNYQSEVCQ